MHKLARFAPLALVTLVGLPVADARDYDTTSSRTEYGQCDSPTPNRERDVQSKSDVSGVRPDASGKQLVNPSRENDAFHPGSNVEIRYGKPEMRPDAKRDAFTPVDDSGRPSNAIDRTTEIGKGKPALRQEPKRDAFTPAKEGQSKKANVLSGNLEIGVGKPMLRPDAKRDAFMPADETGKMRGVDATYDVARGRPAGGSMPDRCSIAICE